MYRTLKLHFCGRWPTVGSSKNCTLWIAVDMVGTWWCSQVDSHSCSFSSYFLSSQCDWLSSPRRIASTQTLNFGISKLLDCGCCTWGSSGTKPYDSMFLLQSLRLLQCKSPSGVVLLTFLLSADFWAGDLPFQWEKEEKKKRWILLESVGTCGYWN